MKSFLCFLALVSGMMTAGHADPSGPRTKLEADLETARELFPRFQKLLETNPEKARKPFDQFLDMEDPLQLRLQTWLDTRWIEQRRAYESTLRKANAGEEKGLSSARRETLRQNQSLLLEIRSLRDEGEMKERLRKEGWDALETLLAISKRDRKSSPAPPESGANPADTDRELEALLAIGTFRYRIRRNRNQPAEKPREELGLSRPGEQNKGASPELAARESIEARQADLRILEANEKMKGEIPGAEYEGILELNQWRIAMGLNALLIDPKLCAAARDHSRDMKTHGFFAHESPIKGKETPWARAANFNTKASSENIAINNSPSGANRAWFHSPGHHKNMFAEKRTWVGLGQEGRHYTQLFR